MNHTTRPPTTTQAPARGGRAVRPICSGLHLDVQAADAEFHDFAAAIAAGRISDAISPRNRLADRGIELSWQPGRPETRRRSPPEQPRDDVPADPADLAWAAMRAALKRGDYRGAKREWRALNALGFNILVRPEARSQSTPTTGAGRVATGKRIAPAANRGDRLIPRMCGLATPPASETVSKRPAREDARRENYSTA
jgi:hypothetical protein